WAGRTRVFVAAARVYVSTWMSSAVTPGWSRISSTGSSSAVVFPLPGPPNSRVTCESVDIGHNRNSPTISAVAPVRDDRAPPEPKPLGSAGPGTVNLVGRRDDDGPTGALRAVDTTVVPVDPRFLERVTVGGAAALLRR